MKTTRYLLCLGVVACLALPARALTVPAATHSASPAEAWVTVDGTLEFADNSTGFAIVYTLPAGWPYAEASGAASSGSPTFAYSEARHELSIFLLGTPVSPLTFTFRLARPAAATATAHGEVQYADGFGTAQAPMPFGVDPLELVPPEASFQTASSEGPEGTTAVDLSVVLSRASIHAVTITGAIAGGSAQDGVDCALPTPVLVIAAGATQGVLRLSVTDDGSPEDDETVVVSLQAAQNAILGAAATHVYTIRDDDNDAPVAVNDEADAVGSVGVPIPVAANDHDPDGTLDLVSIQVVDPPDHGQLLDHGDGTITYTSAVGFGGEDTFSYRIADNRGLYSNPAVVTITVAGPGWDKPDLAYSMRVYARVLGPPGLIEAEGCILAAFQGGLVRGVAGIGPGPAGRLFQLQVFSDLAAETGLTFRVYDASVDTIFDIAEGLDFAAGTVLGTMAEPLDLHTALSLAVTATGASAVAVTSASGQAGITDYTCARVPYGRAVDLSVPATDPVGVTFQHWRLNGSNQAAGLRTLAFTIVSAADAEAVYTVSTYTVTFHPGAHGALAGGAPAVTVTVIHGDPAPVPPAVVPAPGWTFAGWSPALPATITADAETTAQYAVVVCTVTFAFTGTGALTGTLVQTVAYGASTTPVTAVPGAGWYFHQWNDGSATNPRVADNVTTDLTLTAEFLPLTDGDPDGPFELFYNDQANAGARLIWDFTGLHAGTVGAYLLALDINHDEKGALTGRGSVQGEVGGQAIDVRNLAFSGKAKGKAGSVTIKASLTGSNASTSVSLKLTLTLDGTARRLSGTATGSISDALGGKASISGPCALDIPAGMDGTYRLPLDLLLDPGKGTIVGTGTLVLSNGRTVALLVKGKRVAGLASLQCAGDKLMAPAFAAIKLKFSIRAYTNGTAEIRAMSGKAFGQSLKWP